MKPDYKNWMPKGMVYAFLFAFLGCGAAASASRLLPEGTLKTALTVAFGVLAIVFCGLTLWAVCMYRAFDYNGKRRMARQIIEGTAACVNLPRGGKCLDVGCGSGALGIAVAKRNPKAEIIGIDRWGKEYASFSKGLCERNAKAEGVTRITFRLCLPQHPRRPAAISAGNPADAEKGRRLRPPRHLLPLQIRRYAGLCAEAPGYGL